MRERPILFSAPMVRAILAGGKTQTRRLVKPRPEWTEPATVWQHGDGHSGHGWYAHHAEYPEEGSLHYRCPYGQPGDRLWVREAFSGDGQCAGVPPRDWLPGSPIWWWADGNPANGDWTKPKPGMHMPRWASRITLEITGVRVERLQDISVEDAVAEGVHVHPDHHGKPRSSIYGPVQTFRDLWERINGSESWGANPWVWVIEFQRVVQEGTPA